MAKPTSFKIFLFLNPFSTAVNKITIFQDKEYERRQSIARRNVNYLIETGKQIAEK